MPSRMMARVSMLTLAIILLGMIAWWGR